MKKLIILSIAISVLGLGCAKEKTPTATTPVTPDVPVIDPPDGPFVPGGTGPGQGPGDFDGLVFEAGGTAPFEIDGSTISQKNFLLSEYTGRSMNDPQNFRVNANFRKVDGGTWAGTITTTYTENGYIYYWYFDTGSSKEATVNNVWFTKNNQPVFHAIAEDFSIGAVVLTIDGFVDLGDGAGQESMVEGSLWFKNYGLTYAPHPPTYCWFVYFHKGDTPYDCRPWPVGNGNDTYQSVDPSKQSSDPFKGYKRLGRFSGMSLDEAFNGELNLDDLL